MSLKVTYLYATGQFDQAMREIYEPISEAGTAAMRAAADEVKQEARASIASAGFSKKWQNALRVDAYPKKGASANAAAHIYHKIPYADVFEEGATIRGRPHLWVALPHTPKKVAGKKMTAARFAENIGPLFPLPTRGGKPMLAAKMAVSKTAAKKGPPYKATMAGLRRGAAGQGIVRAVPVFVGLDRVRIARKFRIQDAIDKAVGRLPELYLDNLKDS